MFGFGWQEFQLPDCSMKKRNVPDCTSREVSDLQHVVESRHAATAPKHILRRLRQSFYENCVLELTNCRQLLISSMGGT